MISNTIPVLINEAIIHSYKDLRFFFQDKIHATLPTCRTRSFTDFEQYSHSINSSISNTFFFIFCLISNYLSRVLIYFVLRVHLPPPNSERYSSSNSFSALTFLPVYNTSCNRLSTVYVRSSFLRKIYEYLPTIWMYVWYRKIIRTHLLHELKILCAMNHESRHQTTTLKKWRHFHWHVMNECYRAWKNVAFEIVTPNNVTQKRVTFKIYVENCHVNICHTQKCHTENVTFKNLNLRNKIPRRKTARLKYHVSNSFA